MNKNHKELEPIKQNENGGEVVFEMRYHLSWWDCIVTIVMFLFGCIMILPVIFSFPEIEKHYILFELVWCGLGFGICWCFIYLIFYTRKNRFYITYQGIGFERRNWFRMQKKFFRFGEVGLRVIDCEVYITNKELFIFYPLNHQILKRLPLFAPKDYYKINNTR